MERHFHAVVWIDHRKARVFHFNTDEWNGHCAADRPRRFEHATKRHPAQQGRSGLSSRSDESDCRGRRSSSWARPTKGAS